MHFRCLYTAWHIESAKERVTLILLLTSTEIQMAVTAFDGSRMSPKRRQGSIACSCQCNGSLYKSSMWCSASWTSYWIEKGQPHTLQALAGIGTWWAGDPDTKALQVILGNWHVSRCTILDFERWAERSCSWCWAPNELFGSGDALWSFFIIGCHFRRIPSYLAFLKLGSVASFEMLMDILC